MVTGREGGLCVLQCCSVLKAALIKGGMHFISGLRRRGFGAQRCRRCAGRRALALEARRRTPAPRSSAAQVIEADDTIWDQNAFNDLIRA